MSILLHGAVYTQKSCMYKSSQNGLILKNCMFCQNFTSFLPIFYTDISAISVIFCNSASFIACQHFLLIKTKELSYIQTVWSQFTSKHSDLKLDTNCGATITKLCDLAPHQSTTLTFIQTNHRTLCILSNSLKIDRNHSRDHQIILVSSKYWSSKGKVQNKKIEKKTNKC